MNRAARSLVGYLTVILLLANVGCTVCHSKALHSEPRAAMQVNLTGTECGSTKGLYVTVTPAGAFTIDDSIPSGEFVFWIVIPDVLSAFDPNVADLVKIEWIDASNVRVLYPVWLTPQMMVADYRGLHFTYSTHPGKLPDSYRKYATPPGGSSGAP